MLALTMTLKRSRIGAVTAALLALLMLSFASVQSITMQAAMAAAGGMPRVGDDSTSAEATSSMPMSVAGMSMAGMAMDQPPPAKISAARHHRSAPEHRKDACPYCAAAAHAPIMGAAPLLRMAMAFVFTAFLVVASHGPRGPPSFQPRARGPPAHPRSVLNRGPVISARPSLA